MWGPGRAAESGIQDSLFDRGKMKAAHRRVVIVVAAAQAVHNKEHNVKNGNDACAKSEGDEGR